MARIEKTLTAKTLTQILVIQGACKNKVMQAFNIPYFNLESDDSLSVMDEERCIVY